MHCVACACCMLYVVCHDVRYACMWYVLRCMFWLRSPTPKPIQQVCIFMCVFTNPFCVTQTVSVRAINLRECLCQFCVTIDQIRWLCIHTEVEPYYGVDPHNTSTCQPIPISHTGANGRPKRRAHQGAVGGAVSHEGWANESTRQIAVVPWCCEPTIGHSLGDAHACGQVGEQACRGGDSSIGLRARAHATTALEWIDMMRGVLMSTRSLGTRGH